MIPTGCTAYAHSEKKNNSEDSKKMSDSQELVGVRKKGWKGRAQRIWGTVKILYMIHNNEHMTLYISPNPV